MTKKLIFISAFTGLLGGLTGAYLFGNLMDKATFVQIGSNENPSKQISYSGRNIAIPGFAEASAKATPSVVFIKTLTQPRAQQRNQFDFWNFDFFGQRGPSAATGSGVIISDDGYIVTNNHVVDGADNIEVIMNNNKRSYKAKVVGTDPNTDLALLKVEAKGLPKMNFGNSDQVHVGDWVLAVGNPFNLTSTVTAGIVSAKGRNINVVNSTFPIESFIQTDAAINPGNSGGALVDVNGNLVGINTAIQSNTGSYNGYGFAIPGNMVGKIVKDLIDFGETQRGFTGMDVKDIDAELADRINYQGNAGIYVEQVMEDGPAYTAKLQPGDIILKVDNRIIEAHPVFDEIISLHRPGDKLIVNYLRKGVAGEATIKLFNRDGNTAIARKYTYKSEKLGADITPLSKAECDKFGVESGFKLTSIRGAVLRQMGLQEGMSILKFNGKTYKKAEELENAIINAHGNIGIEGLNPQGGKFNYSFYSF